MHIGHICSPDARQAHIKGPPRPYHDEPSARIYGIMMSLCTQGNQVHAWLHNRSPATVGPGTWAPGTGASPAGPAVRRRAHHTRPSGPRNAGMWPTPCPATTTPAVGRGQMPAHALWLLRCALRAWGNGIGQPPRTRCLPCRVPRPRSGRPGGGSVAPSASIDWRARRCRFCSGHAVRLVGGGPALGRGMTRAPSQRWGWVIPCI